MKTIAVPPELPASSPPAGAGSPAPQAEIPAPVGGGAAGRPVPDPVLTDDGDLPSPEVIPETQSGSVTLEESCESAGSWASRSEPRSSSPERGASGRDAPCGCAFLGMFWGFFGGFPFFDVV